MCVMICAIPKVENWMELSSAVDYRKALQLAAATDLNRAGLSEACEVGDIDKARLPRVMKRSAWLQVHFRRVAERQRARELLAADELPEDRHHAHDAITNAWRGLLSVLSWGSSWILSRSSWRRSSGWSGWQ